MPAVITAISSKPLTAASTGRGFTSYRTYGTNLAAGPDGFLYERGHNGAEAAINGVTLTKPNALFLARGHPEMLLSAVRQPTGQPTLASSVWPNPSAGPAALEFTLPAADNLVVAVYDARGQRCARLPERAYAAGPQRVALDAARWNLPAGVYTVQVLGSRGLRAIARWVVTGGNY